MTAIRFLVILLCSVSTVYFALRTFASIQRVRSIGFVNHYRLYMPIAGALISLGATWTWIDPGPWYLPMPAVLLGVVIALRETLWAVRAEVCIFAARRALWSERSRYREHSESDRKTLSGIKDSLESAAWACKARRFRDGHASAKRALCRLRLMRTPLLRKET